MPTRLIKDHHSLTRNLKLNGNYISNDGGSDGISINDSGEVKLTSPLKIQEAASAVGLTGAYGQLWVKTATPNELYFTTDGDNDIQLTSGTGAVFVSNNADDTMAGTLTIDKDRSTTSATTTSGLVIDVDRSGDVSSGFDYAKGIDCDVRATGASGGIITTTGMLMQVTGDSGGASTARGITLTVSGADNCHGISINSVDGGEDFKNSSSANANDYFLIKTEAEGATTLSTVDAGSAAAHLTLNPDGHIHLFKATGFTQIAETFSSDVLANGGSGTGGTHDTDIDFRATNKISIVVGAIMNDMNLIFPDVSGNFLLAVRYEGDFTIDSWKVWTSDATAATGDNVYWPGGTEPDPTASGRDIFSFYWDATNELCYGVATLNFLEGN